MKMRIAHACGAMFAVALILAGILRPAGAAAITVRDATGKMVTIADTSRIVSIGGAITEILYALGQDKNIVAVDTTSLYPPRALREKPNVGYMRQLSPEGVLGLQPTLIIASEGSGPKDALAVIESAGIAFVHVPDRFDGEGIVEKIRLVAAATGQDEAGDCLARNVKADLAALAKIRAQVKKPARVIFILSFMNGRAMVAGKNTAADGIIRLAGAVNAVDDFESYKIVSDEAVVAANPDSVLTMMRSSADNLTRQEVLSHAAFRPTRAAAEDSFIMMDGLYLLGFGPRTARAARDLANSLYPEIAAPTLPSERTAEPAACGK